MFRNYLVTALRNIARHKLYSFINIAGLTVGLTCAIFIILFIRDQLSYDKWIPDSENLYRVEANFNLPGEAPIVQTQIPFPVTQAMLDQIPEVKARTRLMPQSLTVLIGDRQFPENISVVDPNFFTVIKLPLLRGDPATVLAHPESAVLSQATAKKYFGAADAVGKTLLVSGQSCDKDRKNCKTQTRPLVVSGILKDLPHNTQMAATFVIPNTSAADPMALDQKTAWASVVGWGYVALAPGADPNHVLEELKSVIDRSLDPVKLANIKMRGSALLAPRLNLFRDDHLSTDQYGGMTPSGSWTEVYGFAAVGILILLAACFNFTNLATARATMRAREIALRKVLGATRRQLIGQFLGESVLMALLSLILALAPVEILLAPFDTFVAAPISFGYFSDWPLLLVIVGVAIAAGLVSGAYPALVLSGFRPASSLRTSAAGLSGSSLLRTCLVVVQFAVSIILGIAVIVIFAQLDFAQHLDLGFRKDNIVYINGMNMPAATRNSFVQALRTNPAISGAAFSDDVPLEPMGNNVDVHIPGASAPELFRQSMIDPDFISLYGIKLLAGRLLSDSRGEDRKLVGLISQNILIDATAARRMGYSLQGAIGKTIKVHTSSVTIVGVVADIKAFGFLRPVPGTVYGYEPNDMGQISVHLRQGRTAEGLAAIDTAWRSFMPTAAIQRQFVGGGAYAWTLQTIQHGGEIFAFFVGIAIVIACLGLFGLAAFTAQRRTKEIGIRKVFGARTRDLIFLLLWQFSIPVLIANLIAWPLAYLGLHLLLGTIAFKISLSPLYFIAAGGAALLIAWATVYLHAFRVARANPIHALRYE